MSGLIGHLALLMGVAAVGGGDTCPDHSDMTIRFTSSAYVPPDGDAADLQFTFCVYSPPTVE